MEFTTSSSSISSTLTFLLLVQLLLISSLVPTATSTSRRGLRDRADNRRPPTTVTGLRVDLTHVDAGGNFSKIELIQRGIKRAHRRLDRLTAAKSSAVLAAGKADIKEVGAPVHAGNGEYLMSLSIGTPPLPFSAILDTGSDLIWTQCKPCLECFSQQTPLFDPSNSTSFTKLPCSGQLCKALPTSSCTTSECDYVYSYGDQSSTEGYLASETFTFRSSSGDTVTASEIGFGCGDTNVGSGFGQGAGLVGLGRGPLSLISQLGSGKFSYCLTSIDDTKTSPLVLGSLVTILSSNDTQVVSTPLIKNPTQPSFYYLNLIDITVGGSRLSIPTSTFKLQENGSGGVIIDSGTTITYLEEEGYKIVKKAFTEQVDLPVADGSPLGLDLCFSTPEGTKTMRVPNLVLHFDKGADLEMPADNYMVLDSDTGLLCLMMMESSGMSIIGNMQQQNMQVIYDLEKETLSFVPALCDRL